MDPKRFLEKRGFRNIEFYRTCSGNADSFCSFGKYCTVGKLKGKTARAAALSESLPAAQANAEQAAKVDLASYGADYDPNSLRVTVYPDSSSKWTKGSYFKCEVSVNFRGVTSLVNRKKGFSLVMAVEHEIPSNVQAGTAP